MKAVILAAGEGRRLRPLTEKVPKCLVPLEGRPLLDYWLKNCAEAGVTDVHINGYYLADQVATFLETSRNKYAFQIFFHLEFHLSGTGGFIRKLYSELHNEDFFFFCHGDNFTNLKISDFVRFHQTRKSLLSIALFHTKNPSHCGIVEKMDADGLIRVFIEKPIHSKSNLASAASFLMSPKVFEAFPNSEVVDFSREVLPKYQGQMYGFDFEGFNIDVGTLENYQHACKLAEEIKE
jgi:mannose-1-phosphate guanylyltransferase